MNDAPYSFFYMNMKIKRLTRCLIFALKRPLLLTMTKINNIIFHNIVKSMNTNIGL